MRRDAGHQFRVLEEAEDINAQMPAWVAGRIGEVLNDGGKAVKDAKILVLGAAYKPDVGDVRESPCGEDHATAAQAGRQAWRSTTPTSRRSR